MIDLAPGDEAWCLMYVSKFNGNACGQCWTGYTDRLVRSDVNPLHFATWRTFADVVAWMGEHRLELGRVLPFGVGYLEPVPFLFERAWLRQRPSWFDQVLFELPRRDALQRAAAAAAQVAALDAAASVAAKVAADAAELNSRHATGGPKVSKRDLAAAVARREREKDRAREGDDDALPLFGGAA